MTEQRVAFITGATSGIGLACTHALLHDGFAVWVGSRNEDDVSQLVKNIHANDGIAGGATLDVAESASAESAVKRCIDHFGRIDVVVNNAGRGGGGPVTAIDDELWDSIVNTNLTGTFRVTREVLRHGGMAERGWGRVINIASTGGKQGVALATPYSASKNGVIGFTKALGMELAATGVTANAVCPGFVETPMAERIRQGHASHFNKSEHEIKAEFESRIPIGRYVDADEVAAMVSYLASPGADPVTCQALNVCGGLGRY